jgi:hypothetical protein
MGLDVPRVRIPVNFYQGTRIRPLVLVMDGSASDPLPIFAKLQKTFDLEKLLLEGGPAAGEANTSCSSSLTTPSHLASSPADSASSSLSSQAAVGCTANGTRSINTVEQVARLLRQGRQHNMVLYVPKLSYRGELLVQQEHFFEQTDDIQREMTMASASSPGSARTWTPHGQHAAFGPQQQQLRPHSASFRASSVCSSGLFPSTPDRLTFRIASAEKYHHALSQSPTAMSAVRVNASPNTFCFLQGGGSAAGAGGRDSALTPFDLE